jgi:uncharacterized protein YuzE
MASAYYDPAADIAWFPTGDSDDVVSERVPGGLHDYDRATHQLVAIEVWDASTRLPANLLEALPAPESPRAAHEPAFSDFAPLREDDDTAPARARPVD